MGVRAVERWGDFHRSAPELAEAGERLMTSARDGVAFLATTRRGEAPQLHPVIPRVVDSGLYVFIVNLSSKYQDLLRDGRYALHALPGAENREEFLIRGRAALVADAETKTRVQTATGAGRMDFEVLFELMVSHGLRTTWAHWGEPGIWPTYTRWKG